jgi:hypothetical protein
MNNAINWLGLLHKANVWLPYTDFAGEKCADT